MMGFLSSEEREACGSSSSSSLSVRVGGEGEACGVVSSVLVREEGGGKCIIGKEWIKCPVWDLIV